MAGTGGKRPGAGRKKGTNAIAVENARAYVIKRIADELGPLMDTQIKLAKSGDARSLEYLLSQGIGKPKESVEITGGFSLKLDV